MSHMAMTTALTSADAAIHAAGAPTTSAAVLAAPQAPQAPQAGPGGALAGGGSVLVLILLAVYLHNQLKSKKVKLAHVLAAGTAGVLLAGSVVGAIAISTSSAVGGSLNSMMTNVTGSVPQQAPNTGTGNGR
ncbi:hypothetical protein [Actinomadura atramentaria]|uniref:hypothetical protein n=1 Tax=Actinomadura atramentaria TaxID=1990 RepID=UPI00039AE89D|nr:hypothetical protein [Actinomadura atramentaria]